MTIRRRLTIALVLLGSLTTAVGCAPTSRAPAAHPVVIVGNDPLPTQYVGLADANGQGVTFAAGNVPVSGTIAATNAANGTVGGAAPTTATLMGGADGSTLRATHLDSTGAVYENVVLFDGFGWRSASGTSGAQPAGGALTAGTAGGGATAWAGIPVVAPVAVDPCQSPAINKPSVAINITTATTTEVVAAVASAKVFVCGWSLTAGGTTPTALIETGTKTTTACDTGAAALTGAMAPSVGANLKSAGTGAMQVTGAASGEICIVSGGTTPSLQGYLSYVQQ